MDKKIIAIPFNDPNYNTYTDISQIPAHIFNEMTHFFTVYKELEGKQTAVSKINGSSTAMTIIEEALERYKTHFCT